MLKILVTGGAGFIGSHVVDAYINSRHRVVVIDNLSHGNKAHVHPKARFYKADIRDGTMMRRILRRERPQIINHHAALSTVVESMRDPMTTLSINVTGTVELLRAATAIGIQKFIFASTGGTIYGNAQTLPTPETAPLRPISMYALSKQLGEELILYFARVFTFRYLILRYGNIFGLRQDPFGEAGVVALFSQQMSRGKRVTIFGNGKKTRDYVYIQDAVRANTLGIRRGNNTILNIGGGQQVSDHTVYRTIRQFFPHTQPPRYQPVRTGEVMYGALRSVRAKQILGWGPEWTLKEGMRDYLKHMHYV